MAALPRRRKIERMRAPAAAASPLAMRRVMRLLSHELGPQAWHGLVDGEAQGVAGWIAAALTRHDPHHDGPLMLYRAQEGERLGHVLVAVEDQPFLTDTVRMALNRAKASVLGMAHPVVQVVRDAKALQLRTMEGGRRGPRVALIYAQVRRPDDDGEAMMDEIRRGVDASVRAVADFVPMTARMEAIMGEKAHLNSRHDRESTSFLRWLLAGNFVFLGYRQYRYQGHGTDTTVQAVPQTGLGMLRAHASRVQDVTRVLDLHDSLERYLHEPGWLILSKTPEKSIIHRPVALDYVAVLIRNPEGHVIGEHRWVGLYTSQAMTAHVRDIPLVRQKVSAVLAAAPWSRHGHTYRALVNVLETYARDELLLTPAEQLLRLAGAMAQTQENPQPRLLIRIAPREQAMSCYVLLPLAKNNTQVRGAIQNLLVQACDGHDVDFNAVLDGDNEIARLFFRVRTRQHPLSVDEKRLEEQVKELVTGWEDRLRTLLVERQGLALGEDLWMRHVAMGDAAYRDHTSPDDAALDVDVVARTMPGSNAWHLNGKVDQHGICLRIYREGCRWPLARLVPLLDSFGLEVDIEEPHRLQADGVTVWVHVLSAPLPDHIGQDEARARFNVLRDALMTVLGGTCEQDSLNRLVLMTGLDAASIFWLRALVAYAQQVRAVFHPAAVRQVLLAYPAMAGALVALARARLQPGFGKAARARMEQAAENLWEEAMKHVRTNTEERTLVLLWHVTRAMVRTNAWHRQDDDALAFKTVPDDIPELPAPLPWREIFVYHPTVEGVHLRGGPVARGGLRHSDRRQDYRTEVLGLMDAQVKKNVIIVPTGAKGGFYVKDDLPDDPALARGLVEACYVRYVRALLSVTDNRHRGEIVPPRGLVRLDGDDPYLVVAADKGTATFSDLANATAVAARFWDRCPDGFWLGDAFASGGSRGYDHKAMGITARGAWVSVMHHAAQLDILPSETRPLCIAGIGDMSGDVFGNGLLRDKNVKLVAAFNHKHIFIDPAPDCAKSFAERKRLFEQRLGWDGYDKALLGKGGGVYRRDARSIDLSREARALLGMGSGPLEADDVIKAILCAPVDVLWNGGIGTYIKATAEAHAAANDKANDAVRADAKDVRARIIGEGGNLGITTMGRVELALRGVQLNTDALDNSAGVDTSDHEVNLKVLLHEATERGWLADDARDTLLRKATQEVADLVLANNHAQNWAVTLASTAPASAHQAMLGWQQKLAEQRFIHPAREGMPSPEELAARKDGKYTRPELFVLLSATKRMLRASLAGAAWLNDDALLPWILDAFPASITAHFGEKQMFALLKSHPLRTTLAEMVVVNTLVNRLGMTQTQSLRGESTMGFDHVLHAMMVACEICDARTLWKQLDACNLHPKVARAAGVRMRQALAQLAGWLLSHAKPHELAGWRKVLRLPEKGWEALSDGIPQETFHHVQKRVDGWRGDGVSAPLATALGHMGLLVIWPKAVRLAKQENIPQGLAMRVLVAVSEALQLPRLTRHVRKLEESDGWERQATAVLVQELLNRQRELGAEMVRAKVPVEDIAKALPLHVPEWKHYQALMAGLGKKQPLDVPQLTVLVGSLRAPS